MNLGLEIIKLQTEVAAQKEIIETLLKFYQEDLSKENIETIRKKYQDIARQESPDTDFGF